MSKQRVSNEEFQEWCEAFDDVVEAHGTDYAASLMTSLLIHARNQVPTSVHDRVLSTPYQNTDCGHPSLPEGLSHSQTLEKITAWNAMAMVVRAGKRSSDLGGHIATYASSATLVQIGLDYFFRSGQQDGLGDLIYFQGHAAPGVYARSFIEGRLTAEHLDHFRQEVWDESLGLSAYPHPWRMPDYWQFATVSMGLGPLCGIGMAKWLLYMDKRGLSPLKDRKVLVFCGDGEMDEPESRGCLHVAAEYGLGHLIFVVNCNLQRLDGPVRGNGKIIQELESSFLGAGWRVIKLIWNSAWESLFLQDQTGKLQSCLESMVDGMFQTLSSQGPDALLAYAVEQHPELTDLIASLPSTLVESLGPGGHDHAKVFAAYHNAYYGGDDRPTVVLVHTQKGYGVGQHMASLNKAHQVKKMTTEELVAYADFCGLALSQSAIESVDYFHPGSQSEVVKWACQRRESLGGFLPYRYTVKDPIAPPKRSSIEKFTLGSGKRSVSSTMVFVQLLMTWLKDEGIKDLLIPIVADESRTFGMEGLFRQIGIFNPQGQQYQPEDAGQLAPYRESIQGQLLQEGLNEAGAMATWIAAATAYSHSKQPFIPLYIYYSMFGFQRVGDLIWAAADMRARGFLLGATSGRTTLAGEGLQHCDGQSMMSASMVPNCVSYDPCYGYELAVIMLDGLKRMLNRCDDVFYYVTLTNENDHQPAMPPGVEQGIIKGMYPLTSPEKVAIHLLGSGRILPQVVEAAEVLEAMGVSVKIWSVTSFTELAREAEAIEWASVSEQGLEVSYVKSCLGDGKPVVAATDYVKAYAEQIRAHVDNPYATLGTDGFGCSDTRAALRTYFRVDKASVVMTALKSLASVDDRWQAEFKAYQSNYSQEVLERNPMLNG